MRFGKLTVVVAGVMVLIAGGAAIGFNLRPTEEDDAAIAHACDQMGREGLRPVAGEAKKRFLGKVSEAKARCRGGERAVAHLSTPWVDWSNYWGTGDASSISDRFRPSSHIFNRAKRGVDGALLDLEYQRMELIKFNLFDNLTYEQYATDESGPTQKVWPEMRLPEDDSSYGLLRVEEDGSQLCQGELIRFRTLTGICNDIRNPAMGSTGQLFARNVAFEATYPELGLNELARNRHGDRIGLLKPDPQVISRELFTRDQTNTPGCNHGRGLPSHDADCSYKKAPFFNVLAAFWIQFMTHDWFSHLKEARNDEANIMADLGCSAERVANEVVPLSPERMAELGCRPEDRMDAALLADSDPPRTFEHEGMKRASRAYKTTRNMVTAWWDASQIYGWDERSRRRVRRDASDPAKLMLATADQGHGLLPTLRRACRTGDNEGDCDPIQPEWTGQEAAAFPDNWSLGLSFYHNLFVREHNSIIDEFRRMASESPDTDSGLRNPERPDNVITYNEISDDELFEVARLIVAAEIAKIHTIEWTTQLLYNEPLNIGMNSNWSGVFEHFPLAAEVSERLIERLSESRDPKQSNQLYSAFAAGSGIFGRGSSRKFPPYLPDWLSWDRWSIENPDDVNGGTNHFGAPFNFPEDFPSVYRLHALVPDMLDYRDFSLDPNAIQQYISVVETFRGKATGEMRKRGLANMALTMGRQRLGLLLLRNHPQFLQNLDLRPRMDTTIDVPALDIIRDRERGTPRFNEFRRQIGLRQLASFDYFIDEHLPEDSPERSEQRELVQAIREVYGQHRCDASKVITDAQLDENGEPINDCLGHPDGTMVDNIEDVDLVVGFHAETTRPHGFAISETQFEIFILNASRRLFSDRFFTSSFRPEFYSTLGIEWVMNNGPSGKQWEEGEPNGHKQEVSPLKRVLLRAMPELAPELAHVVNTFDPWARDRGEHYSLAWKPRPDAANDPAFAK
jgi:Animal haem peroxidase